MSCIRIEHGYICGPDSVVDLSSYGAKIWMEWHHYLGPTFFRSVNRITPIVTPSRKTWAAFEKWQGEQNKESV